MKPAVLVIALFLSHEALAEWDSRLHACPRGKFAAFAICPRLRLEIRAIRIGLPQVVPWSAGLEYPIAIFKPVLVT